jgi:hypothetical protein
MAKIPKAGIATAGTIRAEHLTRIIDSLDGTGSYDVVATGSYTGSFSGDGTNITGVTAEWDGTHVGNAEITGSLIVTAGVSGSFSGSFEGDGTNITGVTAEWDGTHNGNAEITGSLTVTSDISSSGDIIGTGFYTPSARFWDGSIDNTTIQRSDGGNLDTIQLKAAITNTQNIDANGSITASSNISASGTIYGNSYQLKNQTLATYAGNILRLTDGAWDYIDINNTTVTIGGGTGDLQLQNITASYIAGTPSTNGGTTEILARPGFLELSLNPVPPTALSQSGIYPGMLTTLDGVGQPGQYNMNLPNLNDTNWGDSFTFICIGRSADIISISSVNGAVMQGTINGLDGVAGTQHVFDNKVKVDIATGDMKVGDKITVTNIKTRWHFEAVCSNGASYVAS